MANAVGDQIASSKADANVVSSRSKLRNSCATRALAFLIAGILIGIFSGVIAILLGATVLSAVLAYSVGGSLGFAFLSMAFSE